jgi:hypothetical protein
MQSPSTGSGVAPPTGRGVALRGGVALGDQIARIETPRDRFRDAMTGLFALCEREPQIRPSRGSTTAGYGSSVLL